MTTTPQADKKTTLHLHDFLRNEHEAILADWEHVDRQLLESARILPSEELRNNIPAILNSLADSAERAAGGTRDVKIPSEGPEGHAQHRWRLGFSLEEVTREYGLLRMVILQKLVAHIGELRFGELVLLNEALDYAIIQSVITFVAKSNKALEIEQERLQVTLKSISDAVISTDTDGRITYFNPAAERISGWSREEALGLPVDQVLITDHETSEVDPISWTA